MSFLSVSFPAVLDKFRRDTDVPRKRYRVSQGDRLHEKSWNAAEGDTPVIDLVLKGDDTIDERLDMFRRQREALEARMEELRHTIETVDYKCWYYETAKTAGTIDAPRDMDDKDVPEKFRKIRDELRSVKNG